MIPYKWSGMTLTIFIIPSVDMVDLGYQRHELYSQYKVGKLAGATI